MTTRLIAACFALALAPLAARAADDEHPYKNAKVGDFVTYKMVMKFAGMDLEGEMTQSVTAKTDKEVTIKPSGTIAGQKLPETETKIDLTKPFDPSKLGAQAGNAQIEKLKEGKEKIKVGDKEVEATWTTYKMKTKAGNMEIEADMKVWMAKGVAMGMAKMETTSKLGNNEMKMTMEVKETGNNKDK